MLVPHGVDAETTCSDRSRLLATRMLHGAASASLYAYRLAETLDPVVHGVTADGSLVVVAVPEGEWGATASGRPVDVRIDLLKKTLDARVAMVVASGHALGTCTWASGAETTHSLSAGHLPPLLADALTIPGARLGFIELERLVLHDLAGAVVVPHADLALAALPGEDLAAAGLVTAASPADLTDLCWAVMVGHLPGTVTRKAHGQNACQHTLGSVFCADIDALGVTLLMVTPDELIVVHARFARWADSPTALHDEVDRLLRASGDQLTA